MTEWNHKYQPESLGSGTTIQNQSPGRKIAEAITEIQEDVPNEVRQDDGGETPRIENNVLYLGVALPDGGEDGEVLQRDASGKAYWGAVRAL